MTFESGSRLRLLEKAGQGNPASSLDGVAALVNQRRPLPESAYRHTCSNCFSIEKQVRTVDGLSYTVGRCTEFDFIWRGWDRFLATIAGTSPISGR